MTTPLQIAQHNTDNTEDGRSEEEDTCDNTCDKGLKSDMSLALAPKTLKKSSKGCWTCKRRKIACDKTLPHCNNCLRTERICEGYGIKLLWPEAGDGRRPACLWDGNEKARVLFYQKSQNYHFLNTTYNDMGFTKNGNAQYGGISSCGFHPWTVGPSRRLAYGFETSLQRDDETLLSYYELILSRMITTIDDNVNGFRTMLLPNALSDQTLSSKSLRQAILALSAYHLWGHGAAMQHKISAIRLLSQSIQSGEDDLVGQFATCMMLCVCDVFDVADGSWYTHLSAAKAINSQLRERGQDNKFLDTWLAYHDVLAGFSKGPSLPSRTIIPQLPSSTAENMIIVGSLGCSPQVLECISCTNDLSNLIEQSPIKRLPAKYASYPETLLRTLSTLRQTPKIISDADPISIETSRILQTAELYRIAALIYLHRSILTRSSTPTSTPVSFTAQFPSISDLVLFSLSIIKSLGICTSPWPLFITACEVEGDDQRVKVLDAIEKMQKERRIGNVVIMRGIVEGVWKRKDLRIEDANNWRAVLGEKIVSFI